MGNRCAEAFAQSRLRMRPCVARIPAARARVLSAGPGRVPLNADPNQLALRELYRALIDSWNARDAKRFADQFAERGVAVGFDGSQLIGRHEIEATLRAIFASHQTATYVTIVRDVRLVTAEVGILRAVVGMTPRGKDELNTEVNAVQLMTAARRGDRWRIELFQNTPAALHGQPDAHSRLSEELRGAIAAARR